MLKSIISSLVVAFSALVFSSLVGAAPVVTSERDVFVPPVEIPNRESVWKIGTNQTVKWDVSSPPGQITNIYATVILVHKGRLDFEHPLAKGVGVLVGSTIVTVPEVTPGDDYQILVMGDSGNTGEFFSIVE